MSRCHSNIFLAKDSKEEAVENDTVTFMTARTKIKTTGLCLVLSEFLRRYVSSSDIER